MINTILTVAVNPAIDAFIDNQDKSKNVYTAGGKGINLARALKCMGVDAHIVSSKGGIVGEKLRNLVKREKMKASWVDVKGETRVNETSNYRHKPKIGSSITAEEISKIQTAIVADSKGKKGIVFSGNILHGMTHSFYCETVREIRKYNKHAFVAVDSRPAILSVTLKCKPEIIKPNRVEAEEVLNFKLKNQQKIKEAVLAFCSLGAKMVLLTLGPNGAIVGNSKSIYHVKSPKMRVQRTVGCGDAFLAGFIFGYLNNLDIRASAILGCAAGSANCTQIIPGKIPKGQFQDIIHHIKVKQL